LALDGFRGENGVALDPVPGLGDGRIEFHTGIDVVAPVVASSIPAEGATFVEASDVRTIQVTFDEPMNTNTGAAVLSGLTEPVPLVVAWSTDG
ncbi:Ig-like domain-containing protein, partial [Acinetobacter baumannii]